MKGSFTLLLAALAVAALAPSGLLAENAPGDTSLIEQVVYGEETACAADAVCAEDCCDDGCCGSCGGGFYAEGEALFFKYHRADGTAVGLGTPFDTDEDVEFEYTAVPRVSLGYVAANGLGIRARYFEFDQSEEANEGAPSHLAIDTYTIDLELFERICLNRCWAIELSGGVHYKEFSEFMFDSGVPDEPDLFEPRLNAIDGWGGVLGLEATRSMGCWAVYGRVRGSVITGDKFVGNSIEFGDSLLAQGREVEDSIMHTIEYALGLECNRELSNGAALRLRAGYEWQMWYNYSSSFAGPTNPLTAMTGLGLGESIFTGPADVGLSGFTLALALER